MVPARVHAVAPRNAPALLTNNYGHPFRLSMPAPPPPAASGAERHLAITRALAVAKSLRYRKQPPVTYCNVYAYDWCWLAGAYLPRVWWTAPDQAAAANEPVLVTNRELETRVVSELSANDMYRWFGSFGHKYGWTSTDPDDGRALQASANDGNVVIVSGLRVGSGSGHVSVVIPDTDGGAGKEFLQERYVPMQAQAGEHNFDFERRPPWWWAPDHKVKAWVWTPGT